MSVTMTRRAMFADAGKLATAAALLGAPAVASATVAGHTDAAIVAALHRWREASLAYVASPLQMESPEWQRLLEVADDALLSVAALPAQSVEGLAIKAFMAMRHEYGGTGIGEMMPDLAHGMMVDQTLPVALVADLLRLSPTLAAAVA